MPEINALLSSLDNSRRMMGENIINLLKDPQGSMETYLSRYAEENIPSRAEVQDARSVMPGMGDAFAGKMGNAALAGIFTGGGAKGANWTAMRDAKYMADHGYPRNEIRRETGWFQGPDGRWRSEITDDLSSMLVNVDRQPTGTKWANIPMPETIYHPEAYGSYPKIRDITVDLEKKPVWGPTGFYDKANKKIKMAAGSSEDMMSGLLHEIQHVIQGEEGFARGGNPMTAIDEVAKPLPRHYKSVQEAATLRWYKEKMPGSAGTEEGLRRIYGEKASRLADKFSYDQLRSVLDQVRGIKGLTPMDAYARLAGEAEARSVQRRMNLTPAERKENPPWVVGPHGYDIPWEQLFTEY